MNIGIIVDNEFNNDIRVTKEVRILSEKGYSIFILCFGYDNKKYPEIKNISIERIQIRKKHRDFLFFFFNLFPFYEILWRNRIKKFINKNKIDVVHAHDLYMAKSANHGIKKSKQKCSLILDLHENYPEAIKSYNWTRGKIRNLLARPNAWLKKEIEYLNYANKLIVLSKNYKAQLLENYNSINEKNITVFPNVIDFKRFEEYEIDSSIKIRKKITFLYFGLVAERRGIFDSIEAFKVAINQTSDISLLIIGPVDKADKERFELDINQEEIKNNIEYIPWIDVSMLPTYLHISHVCLSPLIKNPQHESGIANKVYQYMFGKKAIIASDCAPQKELIEKYNCGLVYTTLNEFAQHLVFMAKNKTQREKMGMNAYQALYNNFNSSDFEETLIGIYKHIAQN